MSPPKKNDPHRKRYNATNFNNFIKQVTEEENKYKSKKNAKIINNLANQIGQRANKAVKKALETGYSAKSMKNLIAQFEKKAGVRK